MNTELSTFQLWQLETHGNIIQEYPAYFPYYTEEDHNDVSNFPDPSELSIIN